MIATLLVAFFATLALASVVTLADAAVRGRNAFRLLRAEMGRIDDGRRVAVWFEGMEASARKPARRPVAIVTARATPRNTRAPERLRAAA
jgi:hypothetical protein